MAPSSALCETRCNSRTETIQPGSGFGLTAFRIEYLYFDSTDDLFKAVVREYVVPTIEHIEAAALARCHLDLLLRGLAPGASEAVRSDREDLT